MVSSPLLTLLLTVLLFQLSSSVRLVKVSTDSLSARGKRAHAAVERSLAVSHRVLAKPDDVIDADDEKEDAETVDSWADEATTPHSLFLQNATNATKKANTSLISPGVVNRLGDARGLADALSNFDEDEKKMKQKTSAKVHKKVQHLVAHSAANATDANTSTKVVAHNAINATKRNTSLISPSVVNRLGDARGLADALSNFDEDEKKMKQSTPQKVVHAVKQNISMKVEQVTQNTSMKVEQVKQTTSMKVHSVIVHASNNAPKASNSTQNVRVRVVHVSSKAPANTSHHKQALLVNSTKNTTHHHASPPAHKPAAQAKAAQAKAKNATPPAAAAPAKNALRQHAEPKTQAAAVKTQSAKAPQVKVEQPVVHVVLDAVAVTAANNKFAKEYEAEAMRQQKEQEDKDMKEAQAEESRDVAREMARQSYQAEAAAEDDDGSGGVFGIRRI